MFYIRYGNKNHTKECNRRDVRSVGGKSELENVLDKAKDTYYEDMLGKDFDELIDWVEVIDETNGEIVFLIKRDETNEEKPVYYENEHYIPDNLRIKCSEDNSKNS